MYEYIKQHTGMDVYFCDAYSPRQRGKNEKNNRVLRQFFPKGSSFKNITDESLKEAIYMIKNRPRKRLGYKTPLEVLSKFFE